VLQLQQKGFSKKGAEVECRGTLRVSFAFADAAAAAAGHRDTVPVHVCSYAPSAQGSGSNVARVPQPCLHEQGAAGACLGRVAGAAALSAADAVSLTGQQRRAAGAAATSGAPRRALLCVSLSLTCMRMCVRARADVARALTRAACAPVRVCLWHRSLPFFCARNSGGPQRGQQLAHLVARSGAAAGGKRPQVPLAA
jgi:hypothetical protein